MLLLVVAASNKTETPENLEETNLETRKDQEEEGELNRLSSGGSCTASADNCRGNGFVPCRSSSIGNNATLDGRNTFTEEELAQEIMNILPSFTWSKNNEDEFNVLMDVLE